MVDDASHARDESSQETSASDRERRRHNFASTVMAIVIALLMRAMLFETYYVPSESMLPTLLVGDHMLVNKFAFGARRSHSPTCRLPATARARGAATW